MGDIKNNSLINIVRNVVYLILLYFLSKAFGLTGVLISFAIPLCILLAYYPRKVCQVAYFTQADIKRIINETLVIGLILVACVAISYSISINVHLGWLMAFALIYAACFFGSLLLLSKGFKREIGAMKKQIITRITPSRIVA